MSNQQQPAEYILQQSTQRLKVENERLLAALQNAQLRAELLNVGIDATEISAQDRRIDALTEENNRMREVLSRLYHDEPATKTLSEVLALIRVGLHGFQDNVVPIK